MQRWGGESLHYSMRAVTAHTWICVENCPVFPNTPDKKKEDGSRGKLCKGKGGNGSHL